MTVKGQKVNTSGAFLAKTCLEVVSRDQPLNVIGQHVRHAAAERVIDPAGTAGRRVASSSKMMKMTPSTTSSLCRHGRAVGEFLPAFDGVNEDRRAQHTGGDVPPADAIAEPLRQREQKEAQYQHEGDVRAAQRLGGDDGEVGERPRAGDGA